MMRSKKLIIGQKYVTSDRDSLKLTIHLNWSITDRVTRAKSDTKDFRNKRLCSSTLWGIYKEG